MAKKIGKRPEESQRPEKKDEIDRNTSVPRKEKPSLHRDSGGNNNSKEPTKKLKLIKNEKVKAKVPVNTNPRIETKRKSVTNYDLKAFLSRKQIVNTNFNMLTVMETVKRMENGERLDRQGGEGDDIDDVEGSLTSASTVRSQPSHHRQPSPKSKTSLKVNPSNKNNFRETVMKAVAKANAEKKDIEPVPNDDDIVNKYSEVYAAVDKTNEEFEAQIRSMKHLPQASKSTPAPATTRKPRGLATTTKVESGAKVALPPVLIPPGTNVQKKKKIPHQFVADFDKLADAEFYKDFKFTFVPLPVPGDALPCE